MKEQLITFKVAKLAKEKRFDIQVSKFYNLDLEGLGYYSHNEDMSPKNHNSSRKNLSAPTQALLQKWLREKYNLHFTVHYHKNRIYSCSVSNEFDNSISSELFGKFFTTYELALEAVLEAALKLIKI